MNTSPYECGFTPFPTQYNYFSIPISYYSFITAFILFDLEILIFIPMIWAGTFSFWIPFMIVFSLIIESLMCPS